MHILRQRNNANDIEEIPREPLLTEEDQSLILLLFLSLILTIFLPCILVISPNLLSDGPVLLSFVILLITGPVFLLTLKEARFLLSGLLTISIGIYDMFGMIVQNLRCDILN